MIRVLLKVFVKDEGDPNDIRIRTKYSVFSGILGLICNVILFVIKLFVGMAMSSIAILSDAFNNLSDTGTAFVSIIGAKLSAKKPDKEHPFGHGRVEYVSSLIVSFIIMIVGFELLRSSVVKIFKPEVIDLNTALLIVLCLSLPIKYWMYSYNKYLGKITNSGVLLATSKDSINDVFATGAVIVSAVLGKLINFPQLDGIVGTVVSFVIMYSGFKISLDTIGILLGTVPQKETIESIRSYVLAAPGVIGVHDLIVHDYGPGRILASVHAEVPNDCNVVEIHEVIDELEHKIDKELGIHIVVHMDPVSIECEQTAKMREMVRDIVKSIDTRMDIHDFRMTDGVNLINLIFDIEVPLDFENVDEVKDLVTEKIKAADSRLNTVINIDFIYE